MDTQAWLASCLLRVHAHGHDQSVATQAVRGKFVGAFPHCSKSRQVSLTHFAAAFADYCVSKTLTLAKAGNCRTTSRTPRRSFARNVGELSVRDMASVSAGINLRLAKTLTRN